MNLFTWNSPCYHLLKYLLFLLKHPVYELRWRLSSGEGNANLFCGLVALRHNSYFNIRRNCRLVSLQVQFYWNLQRLKYFVR